MSTAVEAIGRFVASELMLTTGQEPGNDASLIGSGLLDSLALLRVILFLQEEFGIHIDDGEVTPENFETLGKIAQYVEEKRGPAGAG